MTNRHKTIMKTPSFNSGFGFAQEIKKFEKQKDNQANFEDKNLDFLIVGQNMQNEMHYKDSLIT